MWNCWFDKFTTIVRRVIFVLYNELSGDIDLGNLPQSLLRLDLGSNRLTGTVDIRNIPQTLEWLELSNNNLNGIVDLRNLSSSLQEINLCGNRFEGYFGQIVNTRLVRIDHDLPNLNHLLFTPDDDVKEMNNDRLDTYEYNINDNNKIFIYLLTFALFGILLIIINVYTYCKKKKENKKMMPM